MFILSKKSLSKLDGVHPDMVAVVKAAILISTQDFLVLEGMRTVSRQRELYSLGSSKTMNSRHLTGHAVDLAPYPISWDWEYFYPIAKAMKEAAASLNIPMVWGGDWKDFPDGPHFQLDWKAYA